METWEESKRYQVVIYVSNFVTNKQNVAFSRFSRAYYWSCWRKRYTYNLAIWQWVHKRCGIYTSKRSVGAPRQTGKMENEHFFKMDSWGPASDSESVKVKFKLSARARRDTLGNLQMFPPEMYPAPTIPQTSLGRHSPTSFNFPSDSNLGVILESGWINLFWLFLLHGDS